MSAPVLVFITKNSDSISNALSRNQETLNTTIKQLYPDIRCIWLILDHINPCVLPPSYGQYITQVPICLYYKRGDWDSNPPVVHVPKSADDVILWLSSTVEPVERLEEWMQRYAQTLEFIFNFKNIKPVPSLPAEPTISFTLSSKYNDPNLPVLCVYISKLCIYCKLWFEVRADGSRFIDEILDRFYQINPVRICFIVSDTNAGEFNENIYPKDLKFYAKFFPSMILIPAPIYNEAIQHLGPSNPILIRKGVQIMNGKWISEDKFIYESKYNTKDIDQFEKWFQEAIGSLSENISPPPSIPSPKNKNLIIIDVEDTKIDIPAIQSLGPVNIIRIDPNDPRTHISGWSFYAKWFPFLAVCPFSEMFPMGQDVKIMNGEWNEEGTNFKYKHQYDVRSTKDIVEWYRSCM